METKNLDFPDGFLWGTATASHQIEGGNKNNQWWLWEQQAGKIKNGDSSEQACQHWTKYEEDFNLISDIHNNAYRMSLEWSRIVPEPYKVDQDALEHYIKMIESLVNRNVTPFITLHHFTEPIWWHNEGSLLSKKTSHLKHFEFFVETVVNALSDIVSVWNTINEPDIVATLGYFIGAFPPGYKSISKTVKALNTLLMMHGLAYKTVKRLQPDAKVGLVKNMIYVTPYNKNSRSDRLASKFVDYSLNGATLRTLRTGKLYSSLWRSKKFIKNSTDFIGLNYYNYALVSRKFPDLQISANPDTDKKYLCEGLGWEPYPDGLLFNLRRLKKEFPDMPIYITENGIGTGLDEWRQKYLVHHLMSVHQAIQEGINVRGFFEWSLMDNFEWAEGYSSRFGLYEVDYKTQQRIKRGSAELYSQIAQSNSINKEILEKYKDWPLKQPF
jgi:beta-glucosidase